MVLHRSQRTPAYRVLRGTSSPLQRELAPRSACVGLGLFLGHSVNAICSVLGYSEPTPIEPKDEAAELQRQYIEAARSMARMAERLEKLAPALRAVA